jgi:pilus assembly protein CpaF
VEESASGSGVIELSHLFSADASGRLVRGDGYPPHPERFGWAGLDLTALLASHRRAA